MPAFTLGRLAKLYGMHRSSIYEAVAKGRVSAGLDGNGQRVIDLAEAIRVWGEPPCNQTVKPDTRQAAPAPADTLPDTAVSALLEELRLLREEVAGLRAELRLLEHRPAAEDQGKKPAEGKAKARNFSDLLDALSD